VNGTDTTPQTSAVPRGAGQGQPARAFDRLLGENAAFADHLKTTVHRMGLAPDSGKRLLVLGCGSGVVVKGVQRDAAGWKVVAFDESHALAQQAQIRGDWPADYWFLTGTFGTLEGALAEHGLSGRFDAVLVVFQMRHQRNLDDTLEYLKDLLEPGGTLAVHEYAVRGRPGSRWRWAARCWLDYLPRIRARGATPGIVDFLWGSVLRFDGAAEFAERLRTARYTDVRAQTFGGRQEHVLYTFLARAPKDGPRREILDEGAEPPPVVPPQVPRGGGELFTHSEWADADPEAATPAEGIRPVPPAASAPRPTPTPRPQPSPQAREDDDIDLDDDGDLDSPDLPDHPGPPAAARPADPDDEPASPPESGTAPEPGSPTEATSPTESASPTEVGSPPESASAPEAGSPTEVGGPPESGSPAESGSPTEPASPAKPRRNPFGGLRRGGRKPPRTSPDGTWLVRSERESDQD
jgi:SAM-dependent methyltransferase